MTKRYYWLKLQEDFFEDKWVKKLRRIAGGDTYTCIYLKMILSTLRTEGIITYEGVENTLAEEIALIINEDSDNVQVTVSFLMGAGLLVDMGNNQYYLQIVVENLGSESASAQRVRDFRERQKALHCNTDVTEMKQKCNGEKRREEKENILKDKESFNKSDKPTLSHKKKRAPFKKPSIEQLKEYIQGKSYSIDPEEFFNYYESVGWVCGKVPMKNWKNAVIAWEKHQERWGTKKKKDKNSFQQNTYDFDQLEKDLLRN